MNDGSPWVSQEVFQAWRAALQQREPRALELAYALTLTLPMQPETQALQETMRAGADATLFEISPDVREMLGYAYEKYEALTRGDFARVDVGNVNVLAFERVCADERLLIVNNLTRAPQPVKFRGYTSKEGWDILNRVEFVFPARAQLEAYEFLWLMVEND